MKVQTDYAVSNKNVDKSKTSKNTQHATETNHKSAYTLDMSDIVTDNKAYKGRGKTAEDVMQGAKQQDVATQKNYMVIMSNSMSAEDFAQLQEEGIEIGSIDVEKIVTVVDKIKAKLIEAGVEIAGYTDTLDRDTLTKIVGNVSRAISISNKLKEYDLPQTPENIEEISKALEESLELKELNEGAIKYMIENQMEPTVDSLYKAQYSSTADSNRQGRGYYADDMNGYYAKKAEDFNWEQLQPQMDKVIKESGAKISEETRADAKWLIEKGVPLTEQSFQLLQDLKKVELPAKEEKLLECIVTAMANGKAPKNANLLYENYYIKEAIDIKESVDIITDEAVKWVTENKNQVTICDLRKAQERTTDKEAKAGIQSRDSKFLIAKRRLEEIRLQMTVQANIKLLKQGFSIDTADLEKVVNKLKELEQNTASHLFQEISPEESLKKYHLYLESSQKTYELKTSPAAIIGRIALYSETETLNQLYSEASKIKADYRAAEKTYEAVMTAPRRDLGDSIQKAFRNVDTILEDYNLPINDFNRRAVRILGYNSMDINENHIIAVKEADLSLQKVLGKMTPEATLQLIREGINPLETDLKQLEKSIDNLSIEKQSDADKYAKYLYKLEQSKSITKEEKEAYIGIYRLIRQVEKSDGAVIGSLVNQGAPINFKNLLSAVRTNKQKGMNLTIDSTFGALESVNNRENTISQQITNFYNILAQDIGEKLEPERISTMKITAETTLEQFAEMVQQQDVSKENEKAYAEQELQQVRKSEKVEDAVIQTLLDYNQPVNIDNLLAADATINLRGQMFREIMRYANKLPHTQDSESEPIITGDSSIQGEVEAAFDNVANSITSKEAINDAYSLLKESVSKMVDISIDVGTMESKDMKALSMLYKQISFTANMAKEENYEIPLQINGELTSINLKIMHKGYGKVNATMETESYGKVAAEFSLQDNQITGYIACDDAKALEQLKEIREPFLKELEQNNIKGKQISFVESKNLNIKTSKREENKEVSGVSTKTLYQVAKSFIHSLQNGKTDRYKD